MTPLFAPDSSSLKAASTDDAATLKLPLRYWYCFGERKGATSRCRVIAFQLCSRMSLWNRWISYSVLWHVWCILQWLVVFLHTATSCICSTEESLTPFESRVICLAGHVSTALWSIALCHLVACCTDRIFCLLFSRYRSCLFFNFRCADVFWTCHLILSVSFESFLVANVMTKIIGCALFNQPRPMTCSGG